MAGKKKRLIFITLSVFLIGMGFISAFLLWKGKQKDITIELGMFSGSNWNIANGNSYRTVDRAVAIFEDSHPGVKVHYYSGIRKRDYAGWLAEQVLMGRTPDVFFVPNDQFNTLISQGILMDLGPIIEADTELKEWEYFASAWKAGASQGRQYALPYEADCTLMAVNLTLLKRHGLQMPNQDWTWEDFYKLCKVLTLDEDGDSRIDIAGTCGYTWQEAAYANGMQIFDADGTRAYFSEPRMVAAVRFMQRIASLSGDQLFTAADFDDGRVAFMPMSFATFCTYVSYPYKVYKDLNYEWGCLPMPAGYSGNNTSQVSTLLVGMEAQTKHKKLAYDLLKTLVHDISVQADIYRTGQGASPLRITAALGDSRTVIDAYTYGSRIRGIGLLADILDNGTAEPKFSRYESAMSIADSSISRIIRSQSDAEISLSVLQRDIQALLVK